MTFDSETTHLASRNLMVVGFAIAVVANVVRKNWGFALVLLLASIETIERYRYTFHTWVRIQMLGVNEQVGAKQILQSKLLYIQIMSLLGLAIVLIPYFVRANNGRRLMVLGSLIAIAILSLELISPHDIDTIMYHRVGLFMVSAIGYFAGGVLIACGAVLDRGPSA